MKNVIITVGAALLVAVPATMGLIGNTSFSQSVPVRPPPNASLLDDSTEPTKVPIVRAPPTTSPPTTSPGTARRTTDPRTSDDKGGDNKGGNKGGDDNSGTGNSGNDNSGTGNSGNDNSGQRVDGMPEPGDDEGDAEPVPAGDDKISQSSLGETAGKTESGKHGGSGSGSGDTHDSGSGSR